MTVTVVSGIRDLAPASVPDVEMATADEVGRASELRFGGARGVDTAALMAATYAGCEAMSVYVPWTLARQPIDAKLAIEFALHHGAQLVEMRLPAGNAAFLRRNDAMLNGATRLLAFSDGRDSGGTAYTIRRARALGLDVDVIDVEALRQENPRAKRDAGEFSAPVFALARYVSTRVGPEWRRDVLLALKSGRNPGPNLARLAAELAEFIRRTPDLAAATVIAVMPRRDPGAPSDLEPLAERVAAMTGQAFVPGWLTRTEAPQGGGMQRRRLRFPADEHARTIRENGAGVAVLVLDNVLTTGGSMEGALRAILRNEHVRPPVGLAVLYSPQAEGEE